MQSLGADEFAATQCRGGQPGSVELGIADLQDPNTCPDQRLEDRPVRLPGDRVRGRIPLELVQQHPAVRVHHFVPDEAVPSRRQAGAERPHRGRRGTRASGSQRSALGQQRRQERRGSRFLLQELPAQTVNDDDADLARGRDIDGRQVRGNSQRTGRAGQNRTQAGFVIARNHRVVAAGGTGRGRRPSGHRRNAAAVILESDFANATASRSAISPSASALIRSDRSSAVTLPVMP